MVNDTNTLNGALMELGSLMAQNLTTQGLIGVSASDGLTTLANDILLIQGGGGGGTTTLFEDGGVTGDVNTDYFNLGGTINANVSSDGTNISCSSYQDSARCPNVLLQGDFEITYDLIARTGEGGGWFIILPNNISGSSFTPTAYIDSNSSQGWNIDYNGYSWSNQGTTVPCSVKITREDSTFSIYIDGSLVNQKNVIDSDIYIGWKTHSASGRNFTFKDLKITTLDGGSDCSQYQTEISNAITYINGSGS